MKIEALEAAKNAYKIESECLATMADYFDEEQFAKAVELLKNAERIGTAGCGHSGIICQHMAHLMCCIERPARFISPAEAVRGATDWRIWLRSLRDHLQAFCPFDVLYRAAGPVHFPCRGSSRRNGLSPEGRRNDLCVPRRKDQGAFAHR